MANARILVVEDDRKTAETIRLYLEHAGHHVVLAFNGTQALEEQELEPFDLVLLDLMLPRLDGLEVCRRLRARSRAPIIMLTARSTEDDVARGLDTGADDYVTKPFSPRELTARVRAALRRSGEDAGRSGGVLRAGDLVLDVARHDARRGGRVLELTPREFRLLEAFMRAPGRAYSRADLAERAFGADYEALDRTVDAHVMNLRRKIEDDPARPRWIHTVFGVGYRFAESGDAAP